MTQSQRSLPKVDLDAGQAFFLLSDCIPERVRRAATACIEVQRKIVGTADLQSGNRNHALAAVSEETLRHRLRGGEDVHGIATQPEISDVVVINADRIETSVHDDEVRELRRVVDDEVNRLLRGLVAGGRRFTAVRSGHFWYPPNSHMGWHTNNRAPGWRVYLSHSEQPGQSFFRYRDPDTGDIITSTDGDWDMRIFRVSPAAPLWHSVYTETHRFSFGYTLLETNMLRRMLKKGRSFFSHRLRADARLA